jgi:hypothetical protein
MRRTEDLMRDEGVPEREIGDVTASPENVGAESASVLLRRASDVALLKGFAALTHRAHALTAAGNHREARLVRGQRDRLEGEILRRMDA